GPGDDLSIANFPNSILIMAPAAQADQLGPIAERAVQSTWREICHACASTFDLERQSEYIRKQWNYQISASRVFEVYHSHLSLPGDDREFDAELATFPLPSTAIGQLNPYSVLLEWSGNRLGSRKMLRDFEQIGQEGLRCSLCGARTALADYRVDQPQKNDKGRLKHAQRKNKVRAEYGRLRGYWDEVSKGANGVIDRELRHKFRRGDRLCAVCTIRRLAPSSYLNDKIGQQVDFPSTSTLSTAQAVATVYVS